MVSRLLKRIPLFWLLQFGGWAAYAFAFFLSSVPYLSDRSLIFYRLVFTSAAFLASIILRFICGELWRRRTPWLRMVTITLVCCYILGHLCVALGVRSIAWAEGSPPDPRTWIAPVPSALNGVFLLMAWCAIYFGVRYYRQVIAERRRAEEAESRARHAQLLALQYQVQPHFLFNTLNAISTLVVEGESKAATSTIARLADFFRATLETPPDRQVSLADELELTRQYLEIEKVRLGSRLTVRIEAGDGVLSCAVPHLLLQPIVENAVRHGIAPRVAGGTISIRAERIEDCVRLSVANDGTGAPSAEPGAGIGLSNVRDRLQQLYGDRQRFGIQSLSGDGYRVDIELPAEEAASVLHEVRPVCAS